MPAKTAAVAATATAVAVAAALPAGVVDRVGTIDDKGGYWSLAGKGQSGRTGQGDENSCGFSGCYPDTVTRFDVSCNGSFDRSNGVSGRNDVGIW